MAKIINVTPLFFDKLNKNAEIHKIMLTLLLKLWYSCNRNKEFM